MRRLTLSISFLVAIFAGPDVQADRVACVGASNTYGFGLVDRESQCYPAQLAVMLGAFDPGWEVRNFGVNGACVLRKGLLPYVRQSAFFEAQAYAPDVVVIQLAGGNDSFPANWSYKDDFLADFLFLIDAFAQLPSQPQIYVLSPLPFYSNPYGIDGRVVEEEIRPLMAQLPRYRDVQLIDLYTPMEGSRHLFQSDGIHFTAEGTQLVAEIVAATILGIHGTPDFNFDGRVELQDLILLIEHWGQAESSFDVAPAPFGDGMVDANDLAALMRYWGQEIHDAAIIAYWKLDETEGVNALDNAVEHHGIVIGAPAWQPDAGKIGGALEFDGATCVTTDPVLNPNAGPFSVLAWIKGGAPGQVIFSQAEGANWLRADPLDGTLMTELRAVARTPKNLGSAAVITDGDWHRVGFAWDGSNRSLYVDDVLVAEDTQQGLAACYGGLQIGCGKDAVPGTFWSGLIDDVRIYNRAVEP